MTKPYRNILKNSFELRSLKKTKGFENEDSAKEILRTPECDDGDSLSSNSSR
jgi:hypothetical protein